MHRDISVRTQPPSWIELDSRLAAFASEPVFTAMQASSTAHGEFVQAFRARQALDGTPPAGGETYKAAAWAARKAWKAAEDADGVVVELIRTELQGKGRPLGDWQPIVETSPIPQPPG